MVALPCFFLHSHRSEEHPLEQLHVMRSIQDAGTGGRDKCTGDIWLSFSFQPMAVVAGRLGVSFLASSHTAVCRCALLMWYLAASLVGAKILAEQPS